MKGINLAMKFALALGVMISIAYWPSEANAEPGNHPVYSCGVVSGPNVPDAANRLILNVCLSVGSDGTGVGTVSDAVHSVVNAHLSVQQFTQQGHVIHFTGVVQAANTPALVGRSFDVIGVETGDITRLTLRLDGTNYTGTGLTLTDIRQTVENLIKAECQKAFPGILAADLLNDCLATVR